jgi:hypothetical protein
MLAQYCKGAGMLGYYTVKLLGAQGMGSAERIRLETAYAALLEAQAGGAAALMALCEAARAQAEEGAARGQLRQLAQQAEAQAVQAAATWPAGAHFSLSLWTVQDL